MRSLPLILLLALGCGEERTGSDGPDPAPTQEGGSAGEGGEQPPDGGPHGDDGQDGAGEGEGEPEETGPDYAHPAPVTPPDSSPPAAPQCPVGWSIHGPSCLPEQPPGPAAYVRPDAPPGAITVAEGDDLAAAVAAAPAGATVVIHGTHDVNLAIDRTLTLMGADDDATLWNDEAEVEGGGVEPTVKILAGDGPVRLVGLAITGGGPGVWVGHSALGAELEGVVLDELEGYAYEDRHKGGQVSTLTDVAIRRIVPRPGRHTALGMSIWAGARVQADRTSIEEITGVGIWINHFGTEAQVELTLRDCAIRQVHNAAPDGWREPIRIRNLATLTLERTVIEEFDTVGLLTGRFDGAPARTRVLMTDVLVRGATEGDPELPRLAIGRGTDLTATRLSLVDLPGIALVVGVGDDPDGDTPTATIDGLFMGGPGGMVLQHTATVQARNVRMEGVAGPAVRALGDGVRAMELTLEEFEIVDGLAFARDGSAVIPGLRTLDTGGGVVASRADVELSRGVIGRCPGQALSVSSDATVAVADLVIEEIRGATAAWDDDIELTELMRATPGVGIVVAQGGSLTGERVSLRSIAGVGLMAAGTDVQLSDFSSAEGAGHPSGVSGAGLFTTQGASVRLERVRLEKEKWVALMAHDDSTVILRDAVIAEVTPAPCGALPEGEQGSCVTGSQSEAAGIGAVVRNGAVLDLARFEVRGSALAGFILAEGGELDAVDGAVFDNSIGLNVLVDDFDFDRISERVFVYDNDSDVARQEMPVPDPSALLPFGGASGS